MDPRPPDALVDEAIRCPCTAGGKPWCARCECLVQLALARDVWIYEQVTGVCWKVVEDRTREGLLMVQRRRVGGWDGLGYTVLGWLACAYATAHYLFWVLPRTAYLHYTGRITPRDDGYWKDTNKEGKC